VAQGSALHGADSTKAAELRMLRAVLKLDALASGSLGALLAAASVWLASVLGIPVALLVPVGIFLVAFAAWLWYVAGRPAPARPAVRTIIVANLLWVLASIAVVAASWLPLTGLGVVFVLAQGGAVAIFAGAQYAGLRRARPAVG
jgi:hypothetical protein